MQAEHLNSNVRGCQHRQLLQTYMIFKCTHLLALETSYVLFFKLACYWLPAELGHRCSLFVCQQRQSPSPLPNNSWSGWSLEYPPHLAHLSDLQMLQSTYAVWQSLLNLSMLVSRLNWSIFKLATAPRLSSCVDLSTEDVTYIAFHIVQSGRLAK